MPILLGVILLFAALSAALAIVQAMAISRLAPAGEWRGWLFGWWRFSEISQRAGLSGEMQVGIYKRAVIATLVFVVLGLVISGWAVNQRPAGVAVIESQETLGMAVRTAHAETEFNLLRPVAPMPGAFLVES